MQTNIALAGKTVVAGLNWSLIAKDKHGRKKSIREACVNSGLTLGVIVDGQGSDVAAVGLCAKKSEYPSGAALLAAANALAIKEREFGDSTTNANWILIEKIKSGTSAGMYWTCAISDGVPSPGADIIEDLTVTTARLADFVEILEDVQIFSLDPEILEYVADASPTFEKGFEELVSGVGANKNLRPQKIVGIKDWVYMVMAGVAALIVLVMSFSWWSEQQAQEAKLRKLNEQKAQEARVKQEEELKQTRSYQQADELARKTEVDKVSAALARDPVATLQAWAQAADSLPLNLGGWRAVSMSCDIAQCVVSLSRVPQEGTNASLKEILPQVEINEANEGSYVIPLDIRATRNVPLNALPTWEEFSLKALSKLQELNMLNQVVATPGPRKDLTYLPPPLPATPGAEPAPPVPKPLGLMSGVLGLTGQGVWQMSALEDYLQAHEFALSSVTITFGPSWSADAKWDAVGMFYLKGAAVALGASPGQPQPEGMMPPGVGPTPPADQPLPMGQAQQAPQK
jgi:hypothetical protein